MSVRMLWKLIKKQEEKIVGLKKVNRLLGERCTELLKDKGELTDKAADLQHKVDTLQGFLDHDIEYDMDKAIQNLKKENAELRNNGFTVSAMTEQQLKVALEKGEQLEKENAELKETIKNCNIHIKNLEICNDEAEIRKQKLEKENAKLKKRLVFARAEFQRQYKENAELKHNKKTVAHLSYCLEEKMKEHIKDLEKENAELKRIVKMVAMINKGIYTLEGIKAIYEEAEQFLKGENIILEDAQAGNSPFDADEVFNKEMKAYPDEKIK